MDTSALKPINFEEWKKVMRGLLHHKLWPGYERTSGSDGKNNWKQFDLNGSALARVEVIGGGEKLLQDCETRFYASDQALKESQWCVIVTDWQCEAWIMEGKSVNVEWAALENAQREPLGLPPLEPKR